MLATTGTGEAKLDGKAIYQQRQQRLRNIKHSYQDTSLNPVILIAQMLHETANLTSFWSQPPPHNLAGIGVTGEWSPVPKDDWPYNPQRQRYERGVSFNSWDVAVSAHCGRVLAYALPEGQGNPKQAALIAVALKHRPLPDDVRGSATTVFDLAGTWAADEEYGVKMVKKIRGLLAGE